MTHPAYPDGNASNAATTQAQTVLSILQQAGFHGSGLQMAYAIVMAESGGNADASNTTGNSHGTDRGLFQINDYYHPEVSDSAAYDPLANAKAAYRISDGGTNWSQWATFNNGAYKQYYGGSTSALVSAGGSSGGGGSTMLKVGSSGSSVKALQSKLGITADGIYGPQTAAAVKKYQQANGLSVDGIAGPQTLAKMGLSSSGGGGTSSSSSVNLSPEDFAARYGFNAALFQSDNELRSLVSWAVSTNPSQAQFDARLHKTNWYKTHTATQREFLAGQLDDPASAAKQLQLREQDISQQARDMGVTMTSAQIATFAHASLYNGFSTQQISQGIATFLTDKTGGPWQGVAGTTEDTYRQQAHDMGVRLSDHSIAVWTRNTLDGNASQDDYTTYLRDLAKSAFPSVAKQLDQGMTMKDIANPYVQSESALLELDPNSIDFSTDPLIHQAFSYQPRPDTGTGARTPPNSSPEPTTMPLWTFETTVRQDPRWMKTNNARDSLLGVTTGILQRWGIEAS